MNEDKSIVVPGYGKLEYESDDLSLIFCRTSCFYGPSGTGKTMLMIAYTFKFKVYIPNVILICPTASVSSIWTQFIPQRCIIKEPTEEKLQDIYHRQEDATEVYNKANNMAILESLFFKINKNRDAINNINKIKRLRDISINKIEKSSLNYAEKTDKINYIKNNTNKKLKYIYKTYITANKNKINKNNLTSDEKYSVKFSSFNPSLLLILDDCSAQLDQWSKNETINKLFFQSRYYWVTSLICLHGPNMLAPILRQNAFGNFFTDAAVAMSFFNNKANNFSRSQKKKLEILTDYLFKPNPNPSIKNHKKLIYNRTDDVSTVRYVIAEIPGPFRMGSPKLWELCKKIPNKKNKTLLDNTSKFSNSFEL